VLAQDWRDKLDATSKDANGRGMAGEMVETFERALALYRSANLIITDEDKFPKGYTALFHILNPTARYHLMLCDPWQTEWHEPNGDCILNGPEILGEANYYMKYCSMYLVGTWRLPVTSANFWQTPTFCKKDGGWAFSEVMPMQWQDIKLYWPWLEDSTLLTLWEQRHEFYAAHYDTVWAQQLRDAESNSFAGSQGLSVELAIIEVNDAVLRGSNARLIYTAMTRSRFILFVQKWRYNGRSEVMEAEHAVFKELAYYRKKIHSWGTSSN